MTVTYVADVHREDGQWQATVRDVPGAHTFARTTTALRKRLREVIVLMDDRPDAELNDEKAFLVALNPHPPSVDRVHGTDQAESRPDAALEQAVQARRRAGEAEAAAERATRTAVLAAESAGISMRDTAALLGVSHQRVQQIAASAAERRPSSRKGQQPAAGARLTS